MNIARRLLGICVPLALSGVWVASAPLRDPGEDGTSFSGQTDAGQNADAWGEPVDGVQLRVALATTGPPALPGELPGFEVQIRNRGFGPVTVNPEALVYPQTEVDDVWYAQTFAVTSTAAPIVLAPGSQSRVFRIHQNVPAMFEMNTRPVRSFELRPGPHIIRLGAVNVRGTDGKPFVLVSNRIAIDVPELSAAAEQEALVAQASAGGSERIPAVQRLIARYPDAALPAIERALDATADPAVRSRYVQLAGTLPDERVVPFLLTQIAPGVGLPSQMRAADALLARGRDDGLWPLVEAWEHIDRDRPRTRDEARLLEFLVSTGHPQILDLLGRMSDLPVDVRFAIVQLFLPPSPNGTRRKVLDGGASFAMAVYPGDMRVLPGGVAGAAAVERLLGLALDDTGAVPLEGRHGDVSFTRPRVCEMAAFVLSLRWPAKYRFTWSADAAERDRQVAIIKTTWRRP